MACETMLKTSEAIFAVSDVLAAVRFYRDILGFDGQWLWGDPPTFAGVRWGSVHVMFCQQPDLAAKVEGHLHFFMCDDVEAVHQRHLEKQAPIISAIENKPWGLREYTIRDPNGYHLRFAGPQKYERPAAAAATIPDFIRIVERLPSVEESLLLHNALHWNREAEALHVALNNSLYGAVALDARDAGRERVVGSIRVIGDGAKFFYIQDVMVLPEYQNQRIGSAMMEATMRWLKGSAPPGASVGLFTGKPGFYERYGFQSGMGMSLFL